MKRETQPEALERAARMALACTDLETALRTLRACRKRMEMKR